MNQKSSRLLTLGTIASVLFAIGVVASLIIGRFSAFPHTADLSFNPYALTSLLSTVGTLFILLLIVFRNTKTEETSWFILVMLGHIAFAGGEMMQRFSLDPSSVIFWAQVSGAGATLIGIGVLLFALAYTRPSHSRPAVIAPFLLWGALFVALFYANGNQIFNMDPSQLKHYPWGFNNDAGGEFWVAILWDVFLGLIAGFLLLRFRRRTDNTLLRKQSLLYAIAIITPLAVGAITDGLLPLLHVNSVPPLSTLFELVLVVVVFYGSSKYQLFQINPAVLSANVLSTMNEAVVVTKSDYSIEYINAEAERLLELKSEDIRGKTIDSFFVADSWKKIESYIRGKDNLAASDFDGITLTNTSGATTPVRAFVSDIKEGNFSAHVFVISDISDIVESYHKLESDAERIRALLDEAHRLEQQLETEKNSIAQIVDLRTRELRTAQEELKGSDKLKTEFIMLGSHNLRTPITIMASSLELLKETNDDAQRVKLTESLQQGIDRLKDFVEDMMTIVSLESGSGLQRTPATAASLLAPVIADAQALATTKPGITINTDIHDQDAIIMANSVRLQGALNNIMSNAFKFTQAGSITVSAHRLENSYGISISDTGIGIGPEELPRLFTKFHRGTDTMEYQYDGKGIGLYLTKLIIDEHGGSIEVQSELGRGTTFNIVLPLQHLEGEQTIAELALEVRDREKASSQSAQPEHPSDTSH